MTIPSGPSPARDQYILEAVRNGQAEAVFVPLTYTLDGRTIEVEVMADALKVDGVRVNVSAEVEQQIADMLNASLLTPLLADQLWAAREWTVTPKTSTPDKQMSSTERMVSHSAAIDASLQASGYTGQGIIQTVGKHWVLGKEGVISATKARNYGWHFLGAGQGYAPATSYTGSGVRVWQQPSTMHNPQHVDYSQIVQLVGRRILIDGQEADLAEVLADPELARFVSSEGPVLPRQVGVDELTPINVNPSFNRDEKTTNPGGKSLLAQLAKGLGIFALGTGAFFVARALRG